MHSAHKERAAALDNAPPRRSPTFGIQERPPSCPQRKERSGQRQQGSGRSLTQPRSSIPAIREAEARAPDAAAIRQIGRNGHLFSNPAPIAMRQRRTEISNVPGAAQPGTTLTPVLKVPVSFRRPKPGFNRPHPEAKAKFLRYPALAPRAQTGKGCFCWRGRPNRQPIRSNTFAESIGTWMRDLYGPRHAEAESVQSPRWGLPQTQESRRLTGSILRREQPRRSGAHLRRAGAMLACAITRSIPGLRANCDGSTFPAPQDGSGQNVGNRQRVECRTEQFSST
jgi:hypothetical protein